MKDLERRLNLPAVTAISLSSMLGVSVFVIPGVAVETTGGSAWLAFLIAAVVCIPSALAKAELATAMPTSGGTYVYLDRTFGPLTGLISGFGLWLSLLLKTTFALVGTGSYLSLFGDLPLKAIALGLLAVVFVLNVVGVGKVGAAMVFVVIFTLLSLLGIGAVGIVKVDAQLLQPMFLNGAQGLVSAAALVFISFSGITKVAAIAEEIKKPERNLPRSIILSLAIITMVYCGVSYVLAGNVPVEDLKSNLHPLYTMGVNLGGKSLGLFVAVLAVVAMASMANAGILAASRFPFALSRDFLIPSRIGRVNPRFLTPVYSIGLSAAVVALAIVLLDTERIVKLASAFLLIIYIGENLAVLVLRESRVHWYSPQYKCPMYPFLPVAGIISGLLLLISMGGIIPLAMVVVLIPSLAIYWFYSRHRTQKRGVIGIRGARKDLIENQPSNHLETLEKAKVVVALFGNERSAEMLVEVGLALAEQGKLEVVRVKEIPEQINVDDLSTDSRETSSLRRRVGTIAKKLAADVDFDAIHTHDIYRAVYEITSQLHCNWLIKEWGGRTRGAFTVYRQMGWLEQHLQCNVLTLRDAGVRYIRDILVYVPIRRESVVVNTAVQLARMNDGMLTIAAYEGDGSNKEGRARIRQHLDEVAVSLDLPCKSVILKGKSEADALIDATVEYDLLVARAAKHSTWSAKISGTFLDQVTAKSACSVVLIQSFKDYESTGAADHSQVQDDVG